jgi:hypothetical protein
MMCIGWCDRCDRNDSNSGYESKHKITPMIIIESKLIEEKNPTKQQQ